MKKLKFQNCGVIRGNLVLESMVVEPGKVYQFGDEEAKRLLQDYPDRFKEVKGKDEVENQAEVES